MHWLAAVQTAECLWCQRVPQPSYPEGCGLALPGAGSVSANILLSERGTGCSDLAITMGRCAAQVNGPDRLVTCTSRDAASLGRLVAARLLSLKRQRDGGQTGTSAINGWAPP